jgi:hypothetical protein
VSTLPGHEFDQPMSVVIFWPWSDGLVAAETFQGVLASTTQDTRIVLPQSAPGRQLLAVLAESDRVRLTALDCASDVSLTYVLNEVASASPGADLVLIADRCTLPDQWLERLKLAAFAEDGVAAATTLAIGDGESLFGEFHEGKVLLGPEPDHAATRPLSTPRVVTLWPHCTWIRRP